MRRNWLRVVKHDDGGPDGVGKQAFMYGSTNARPIDCDYDVGLSKIYDRIRVVKHDDGGPNGAGKQAFVYGSTNARLIDYDYSVGMNKFYANIGAAIGPWCLVATYHRLRKLSKPIRTLTHRKKIVDRVRLQKLNFQKIVSPVPASLPSMR